MPRSHPILRVVRPTNDFEAVKKFYCEGLGFEVLAKFDNHQGFDGIILGSEQAPYHLEFTKEEKVIAPKSPSPEDLLVFYAPDLEEWSRWILRLEGAGYFPVKAHNPYWDVNGKTFEDPEGYRVVIQRQAWTM